MPYWRGEGGGGGHYKKHTTISVLAVCVVLCTLSDNTYVHVHVCGSARSGTYEMAYLPSIPENPGLSRN